VTPLVNSDATIVFPAPKLVLQHILMTCVPYFFTKQQAINTSLTCVCKEHRDPNCTTSMVPVSPSWRSPRHHPPPPLEANTHVADAVPLPATNSSGGPNGAYSFIVVSLLTHIAVTATRTNGHINSNKYADPSHIMLVDCCMLYCRECGPIAAV
jgi:hypothetical protein